MVSVKFGVKIQFYGHQKAQQDGMVFMAEKNDRFSIKKTVSIWRGSEGENIFSLLGRDNDNVMFSYIVLFPQ